tara:strand:- start:287 stop:436 length:150 start_codon:yes stop_codon:yes gene_type:complete
LIENIAMNGLQKQLIATFEQLDTELKRAEPSDVKLEFLYRKIAILEAYL